MLSRRRVFAKHASWIMTLAASAAVLVLAAGSVFASATIGEPAPALVTEELSGETFDLATLRGKVAIVNFWATWCPPCRAEMPALDAFYQRYHSQGLEMIGLSADRSRDQAEVRKVMQSLHYPAAMLDDARTNGFGSPTELPVTYVIDANGAVRAKFSPGGNAVTKTTLNEVVLPLLTRKADATPSSADTRGAHQ
jgi:cytochrome c biogenesis protein CcmG, thiol:disulfide interchange protein DsbE